MFCACSVLISKPLCRIHFVWPDRYCHDTTCPYNDAILIRSLSYVKNHHLRMHKKVAWDITPNNTPQYAIVTSIACGSHILIKTSKHASYVSGLFRHYVNDVRAYRLSDTWGHITIIHATPNHPFYVKNIIKRHTVIPVHQFIPISKVTHNMTLLGIHGDYHLICKYHRCSTAYKKGKMVAVYNLETYQYHRYLVSDDHLLVHNCNITKESSLDTYTEPLNTQKKQSDNNGPLNNLASRNEPTLDQYHKNFPEKALFDNVNRWISDTYKNHPILYRGDTRDPDKVFQSGFLPRFMGSFPGEVYTTPSLFGALPYGLRSDKQVYCVYIIDAKALDTPEKETAWEKIYGNIPNSRIAGCMYFSGNAELTRVFLTDFIPNKFYTGQMKVKLLLKFFSKLLQKRIQL